MSLGGLAHVTQTLLGTLAEMGASSADPSSGGLDRWKDMAQTLRPSPIGTPFAHGVTAHSGVRATFIQLALLKTH